MKISIITLYGGFSTIAYRMGQEIGFHNLQVIYFYKDYKKWWSGLIPREEKIQYSSKGAINTVEEVNKFKPDFCIFDMSGEGEVADRIKDLGIPVIGASEFCDFLELNRFYGSKIFETLGFSVPGYIQIKDYKDAIKFLKSRKDQDERWVVKFNDNQGNFSSYVSTDIKDMLEELEHFNDSNRVDFSRGAIIQEYIKGIELSCEGWFDGHEFILDGFNYTMEEKKFLTGSLGPSTGCEGNLVWKAQPTDKIPKQFFRLVPLLRKFRYIGPFDLNNICATESHQYEGFSPIKIGENYPVEPTPRFGYDAIYTFLEGYKGLISNFFAGLVSQSIDSIDLFNVPLMGIRVSIPPYPYNDISQTNNKQIEKLAKATLKYMLKSTEGTIVRLKNPEFLQHIWFQDIRLEEGRHKERNNKENHLTGRLVVNGTDSVISVVTNKSSTLKSAIEKCYQVAQSIDVPNPQYRLDIGRRAFTEIPSLVELKIMEQPTWWETGKKASEEDLKFDEYEFFQTSPETLLQKTEVHTEGSE